MLYHPLRPPPWAADLGVVDGAQRPEAASTDGSGATLAHLLLHSSLASFSWHAPCSTAGMRLRWASCLVLGLLWTGEARAEPVVRYETRVPVSTYRAGAAKTVVGAPEAGVLALVTDYAHYSTFIKAFETSRVVGRDGDKTDVYLRVKILKGAATIWAIVRFEPPKVDGDVTLVTAHLLKGNVKRLDAYWHLKKTDGSRTELVLELLIIPDLPAPEALVVPEVRDAAATAVTGVRDEAEKRAAHP